MYSGGNTYMCQFNPVHRIMRTRLPHGEMSFYTACKWAKDAVLDETAMVAFVLFYASTGQLSPWHEQLTEFPILHRA